MSHCIPRPFPTAEWPPPNPHELRLLRAPHWMFSQVCLSLLILSAVPSSKHPPVLIFLITGHVSHAVLSLLIGTRPPFPPLPKIKADGWMLGKSASMFLQHIRAENYRKNIKDDEISTKQPIRWLLLPWHDNTAYSKTVHCDKRVAIEFASNLGSIPLIATELPATIAYGLRYRPHQQPGTTPMLYIFYNSRSASRPTRDR